MEKRQLWQMAFDLNLKWNAGNESCFAFEFGKWLLT